MRTSSVSSRWALRARSWFQSSLLLLERSTLVTALVTAACAGAVSMTITPGSVAGWPAGLAGLMAAVALIDVRHYVIPNGIVVVLGAGGLAYHAGTPDLSVVVGAGVTLGALAWAIRWASTRMIGTPGLGLGDVKLLAALGLCLGPSAFWAAYLAALTGAVAGSAAIALHGRNREAPIPFGACLAAGVVLAWLLPASTLLSLLP